MDKRYNLNGILNTLYQWRKAIVLTTALVAVLSVIIVMLLPVYYQAKTIFYAASQDLYKPEKIFGGSSSDMFYYGGGEDIDRIHTLANSSDLTSFLIDSFNLYEVYNINPESDKADYYARMTLLGLYDVIQTKYDALELTIEDTDPDRAAAMANAARDKINTIASSIIKNSQQNMVASYEASLTSKEFEMNKLSDSLTFYRRKYGIYSPAAQTEFLSNRITSIESKLISSKAKERSLAKIANTRDLRDSLSLLRANIDGLEEEYFILDSDTSSSNFNIRNFNASKGVIEVLEEQYQRAIAQFSADKERVKYYKAALGLKIDAIHLVEKASTPQIKFRPRRSVLVIAATFAAFLFSVIGVLLFTSYKTIDWKKIREGE